MIHSRRRKFASARLLAHAGSVRVVVLRLVLRARGVPLLSLGHADREVGGHVLTAWGVPPHVPHAVQVCAMQPLRAGEALMVLRMMWTVRSRMGLQQHPDHYSPLLTSLCRMIRTAEALTMTTKLAPVPVPEPFGCRWQTEMWSQQQQVLE